MPPRAWRTATAFVRWLQASSLIQYIYISSHLLTSSYFWQYCLSEKKGEDKKKRKKDWEDPLHFFSVCVWPAISRGFLFFRICWKSIFFPMLASYSPLLLLLLVFPPGGPWVHGFDLQGGISPDPNSFLQKYAMIKLYESCFGAEHMHNVSHHHGHHHY